MDPVLVMYLIIADAVLVAIFLREFILSQLKKYRVLKIKEMILMYKGTVVEIEKIKKLIKKCFFIIWEDGKKNEILFLLINLQKEFLLDFGFNIKNDEGSRCSLDQSIRRIQKLIIEEATGG